MHALTELRLSSDETKLLSELLMGDKTRLLEEINHTDRREFREFLRQREEILEGVLTKLNS
jgi:hypothetical protein